MLVPYKGNWCTPINSMRTPVSLSGRFMYTYMNVFTSFTWEFEYGGRFDWLAKLWLVNIYSTLYPNPRGQWPSILVYSLVLSSLFSWLLWKVKSRADMEFVTNFTWTRFFNNLLTQKTRKLTQTYIRNKTT